MKRAITVCIMLAGLAALGRAQFGGRDIILYNHSPSVAPGFYLRTDTPPGPGAYVTVRAALVVPDEARARDFADDGDRFIKRISATGGDVICALNGDIRINGRAVARRRTDIRAAWHGCHRLDDDEVLLLGDTEDSFDGRYWGPVETRFIEGTWRPLR